MYPNCLIIGKNGGKTCFDILQGASNERYETVPCSAENESCPISMSLVLALAVLLNVLLLSLPLVIYYYLMKQNEKETLKKQKIESKELKQGRSMFDSYYQTNVDNEPISVKSNFYE